MKNDLKDQSLGNRSLGGRSVGGAHEAAEGDSRSTADRDAWTKLMKEGNFGTVVGGLSVYIYTMV